MPPGASYGPPAPAMPSASLYVAPMAPFSAPASFASPVTPFGATLPYNMHTAQPNAFVAMPNAATPAPQPFNPYVVPQQSVPQLPLAYGVHAGANAASIARSDAQSISRSRANSLSGAASRNRSEMAYDDVGGYAQIAKPMTQASHNVAQHASQPYATPQHAPQYSSQYAPQQASQCAPQQAQTAMQYAPQNVQQQISQTAQHASQPSSAQVHYPLTARPSTSQAQPHHLNLDEVRPYSARSPYYPPTEEEPRTFPNSYNGTPCESRSVYRTSGHEPQAAVNAHQMYRSPDQAELYRQGHLARSVSRSQSQSRSYSRDSQGYDALRGASSEELSLPEGYTVLNVEYRSREGQMA